MNIKCVFCWISIIFINYASLAAQTDVKLTDMISMTDSIEIFKVSNTVKSDITTDTIIDIEEERISLRESDLDFDFKSKSWEERREILINSLFGNSRKLSNADSIIQALDKLPSFGIYRDNFFLAGTELFQRPTQWNSGAKFQVSIRQRLTNSVMPFKTFLFFTYTQKAFWDIFKDSFPFRDLNYNPTIGIGRAIIYKNRFLGYCSFQFEHESNGRDGIDSRSWNKLTFSSSFILHERWVLESELSIPLVDGEGNKDIVKYSGWGNVNIEYTSKDKKYILGATMTKRGGWNLNTNMSLTAAIRIFSDSNQFLFIEYYNGYGESMLDYKEYRQRIRAGFVIKPNFLNFY